MAKPTDELVSHGARVFLVGVALVTYHPVKLCIPNQRKRPFLFQLSRWAAESR